jgi:hypothetical protein
MSNIKLASNFETYKEEFTKETGLQINKETMSTYIQYYHARTTDSILQLIVIYKSELFPNSKLIQLSGGNTVRK